MSKRRILQSLSVACSAASLISCAPVKDGAVKLAKNTENIVGCQSFSDDFYDELYRFPLDQKEFPSTRELSEALDQTMRDGRLKDLSEADRLRLRDLVSEIYSILSEDVPLLAEKSGEATITVLSAIELGDRTTPEKVEIQDKLKEKLAELDAFTSDLKKAGALACTPAPTPTPGNSATPAPGSVATPTPTPTPAPVPATDTLFERWKATRHPVVYGALKTISVAYQSCSAGLSKALDSDTPSLKGISIVGTHSDGVGSKREISSLDQLISSQPYLQSYVKPVNGTNCFDVRANPMIYDYGGKPYTTSDQESTFNLFKNAGSGTSVLGIDCSAYVYVSLASAGFKVKASGRLKAIGASGISSSMYANPEGNGLTCLQHASFETTSSLKPGDIVAKSGHVFLIESVGADPFGIKGFTSVDQCKLSNMSISRFDFTILQSSSSKNGIGIHRAKASAYLQGNSMGTGLLSHAVNACKARFGSSTVVSKVSGLSVVRHSGSSDCRDTSIKIERESCVSSCKVP